MSKLRRSIVVLASATAIVSGALILTTHAADQASASTGAQPAGVVRSTPAPPASNAAAANPTAAKPTAPAARSPAPGAPQVPEESATIRDDPTIAPDPKQSADHSVSFPNDT
jgi:hypothetical protein